MVARRSAGMGLPGGAPAGRQVGRKVQHQQAGARAMPAGCMDKVAVASRLQSCGLGAWPEAKLRGSPGAAGRAAPDRAKRAGSVFRYTASREATCPASWPLGTICARARWMR